MAKQFEKAYSTGRYKSSNDERPKNNQLQIFDGQKTNSHNNFKTQEIQGISLERGLSMLFRLKDQFEYYMICTPFATVSASLQIFGKSAKQFEDFYLVNRLNRIPKDIPIPIQKRYMTLLEVL